MNGRNLAGIAICLLLSCHVTWADEPVKPAEVSAFSFDSASGLSAAKSTFRFLGPRSCAATACHGGVDPDNRFLHSQRNEYPFWLDHDPHARANGTLSNDFSVSILKRLARPNERAEVLARRLANCFGCHNPQPAPARQAATFFPRDSISCEICHGAAEKWIGAHVAADWNAEKARDRTAWKVRANDLGFIDHEDLTERATTCAQCHVGSPGREVNHDLIAAGHPVLKFELAAYHQLLPKHWRAGQERKKTPQFDLELWSAGQFAAADAALALLDWRAKTMAEKHPDATWPELSEYDCFACHHDLEDPSWRRRRTKVAGLPLGMPAWGTWYFGPLRKITHASDDVLLRNVRQSLADVAGQMQQQFGGNKGELRNKVATAREQLKFWRQSGASIGDDLRVVLKKQAAANGDQGSISKIQPAGWDEAVQIFLAIVAMDDQARKLEPARIAATRKLFTFPGDYNSPRGFVGHPRGTVSTDAALAEKHDRSQRQIVDALLELIQQLEPSRK